MSAVVGAPARPRLPSGLRRVVGVAASLVSTQAVTCLLGVAFWTLAARSFDAAQVGIAGAAVAAMTLLGSVGSLGLGTVLIARLAEAERAQRRTLVRTCVGVAGVAGAVLGAVIPVVAMDVLGAEDLRPLAGEPHEVALFAVAAGLTAAVMVLDQALLTLGNGGLQLERNIAASLTKVVVLAVLAASGRTDGLLILLAWSVGNVVSLPVVGWRTRAGRPAAEGRPLVDLRLVRRLGAAAASHHALNLTIQAPTQILPILVAGMLTARDNAYFTTALMVAGFTYVLPFSLTVGLFVAGEGDSGSTLARIRRTVPLGIGLSVAANLAVWPLAGVVLAVFGAQYADGGATALRVLALASLPLVFKDHYVAVRRVQGRTTEAVSVLAIMLIAELAAAAAGAALGGLVGLSAAWVGALVLEALAVAPVLLGMRPTSAHARAH